MEKFFVYILYSKSLDRYYIGHSNSIQKRVAYHNDPEKNKIWTKRGIPWEIKAYFDFNSRAEAMKAENFIKKQKSRKTIENIILNGWKSI